MDKDFATFRLGGSPDQAARWIGISSEVYREWPERLHPVMADRVYAAIVRREVARAMGLSAKQFFADLRGETVIESMLTRVSLTAIAATMMRRVPPEYAAKEEAPRKRRGKRPAADTTLAPAAG